MGGAMCEAAAILTEPVVGGPSAFQNKDRYRFDVALRREPHVDRDPLPMRR
jgi:hypothetical protein